MATKRHLERMVRLAQAELEQATVALFLHENRKRHARLKALRAKGREAIQSEEFGKLYEEESVLLDKHNLHWSPSKHGWAIRKPWNPNKAPQ